MQEKKNKWREILFSKTLVEKGASHKIAYVAICVALNVIVNAAASIPLGFVQFSLTLFVSALTGILIGPLFGFAACFLGDTLGFFISGYGAWTPWMGMSMGVAAMIAAFIVNGLPLRCKGAIYVKLAIVCVLTYAICTYAIGTTVAYYLWNSKNLPYTDFLVARLSVQSWNNLLNSVLLFVIVPVLGRIKPLKIRL